MPETNSQSTPNKPARPWPRSFLVACLVLLAAGLIVVAWVSLRGTNRTPRLTGGAQGSGQQDTQNFSPEAEEVRGLLLKHAKLSFPDVAAKKAVGAAQLPEDLKKFIPADAKDVQAWRLTYADRRSGHMATYALPEATMTGFQDSFATLLQDGAWHQLESMRSALVGFVEFQDSARALRVSYSPHNGQSNVAVIWQSYEGGR